MPGLCGCRWLCYCGGRRKEKEEETTRTSLAEVYRFKSEYIEAWTIQILQETSFEKEPYGHALALHNLAQISVRIEVPRDDIQTNIELATSIFHSMGHSGAVIWCNVLQAELNLREGDILGANMLFQKNMRISWGKDSENVANCLERLADTSCWGATAGMFVWPTILLVHSLRSKEKLGIHKALQFLGDIVFTQGDEATAINLFTVALEGFTYMDVHHSRAECMLRLGDISKGHGDSLKAVELWQTARPLFERSSQAKQVAKIDERLAGIPRDVLNKHARNLARLAELNALSGTVEDPDDDLFEIEHLGKLYLDNENELGPVAV
ncbi:hypothetical protein B0H14DRAFT_2605926 [Mycena olivaceomarginata]|nr:hypothetical protein B0H14DRAFT_2605926 [Mycena olivaceomarginata]